MRRGTGKQSPKRARRKRIPQNDAQTVVDLVVPESSEPDPQQVISVLGQQVAIARNAFFKLAKARAADLIRLGQTFDDAAAYVDAEVKALDEQLSTAVPQ